MAVSPERQTNQPLTREAKDRIGAFNLMSLLKANEKRIRVPEYLQYENFDAVAREVTNNILVLLPTSLTETFGFSSNLKWHIAEQSVMSSIVIGSKSGGPKIQDALTVIETSRRSDLRTEPSKRFLPSYLRIAGVHKEQNRIVAATYDLEDQNRLLELSVSIPEFEHLETIKHLSPYEIIKIITAIPTDVNYPYNTAGLITSSMRETVNRLEFNRNESPHSTTLIFEFGKNNSILKKAGYFQLEGNENIMAVGLKKEVADAKDLHHWMITVPRFLPKA